MIELYNEDCLKQMKLFKDNMVEVSFTSPPYNRKRNDKYELYDDTISDYYGFLCAFTDELLRVSSRHVIVNVQKNYYNKKDVFKYIGNYADKIVEIISWNKENPMPASGNNITNGYEWFIVLGNEPLKSNTTYTKNYITTAVNSNTMKIHKAIMKQEIADWFIEKFTRENDTILDCFMGVGTTGISCKKYNRGFIGIELHKEYFDLATKRINEFVIE